MSHGKDLSKSHCFGLSGFDIHNVAFYFVCFYDLGVEVQPIELFLSEVSPEGFGYFLDLHLNDPKSYELLLQPYSLRVFCHLESDVLEKVNSIGLDDRLLHLCHLHGLPLLFHLFKFGSF